MDLKIKTFPVNVLEENCYIVSDATGEAVIIDCGAGSQAEQDEIDTYICENHLTIRHHLLTHGHFDHIFGADYIHRTYGIGVTLHQADAALYQDPEEQVRRFLGMPLSCGVAPVDAFVVHNDLIRFGAHMLRVIHTPGHTPGGVCYYCEDNGALFSGDTVFRGTIGRYDLAESDASALFASVKSLLLSTPPSVTVYPGHGASTTISHERQVYGLT